MLKSTGMGGGMQHPEPGRSAVGRHDAGRDAAGASKRYAGGSGQTPGTHPDFNAILNSALEPAG